jgi:3-oxoacyl-[acyl-carrier-protein] synthase II
VSNANSRAAGTMAIGEAFRLVRDGRADIALAGGAEAPLAPLTFGAFAHINALTSRNDDPQRACRPFDRDRDGFLMAEGGAVLVLEDAEHARERGAEPYAEIAGYATTNDAHHMVAPLPSGEQAARCMLLALKDAGLTPECVDYVSTHATGTPLGDAAEMRAIRHALADHADRVPVSSTKGLHGHALGATGPIETAIVSLALQNAWLPPTTNLACPDSECKLAHVPPHGLSVKADVVVKNAFGFGGANTCLVLRRWREDDSLPG